jgi:hypothetical protein
MEKLPQTASHHLQAYYHTCTDRLQVELLIDIILNGVESWCDLGRVGRGGNGGQLGLKGKGSGGGGGKLEIYWSIQEVGKREEMVRGEGN